MKYAKICGAFREQPRKLEDFTATRGDAVYVMKEKIVKGKKVYKQHIFTIINEPDPDKREYISIDGGCDAFKGKDDKHKGGSDSCLGVQRRVRTLIQGNNELYFADDPDKRPILFWVDITKVRFFAHIVEPILDNDELDSKLADKPKDKPEVNDDHNEPVVPEEPLFETDLNLLTQNIMLLPEELEDLGAVKSVSERRPATIELLKDYDIIGLQEVFDDDSQDHVVRGWYNDILGDSPEWIDLEEPILDQSEELGDMSDRGVFDARPNDEEAQMVCDKHFLMGPDQADLDQDGGLIIFSKYPIIKSSAFVFSESAIFFGDYMANKGVIYARIDITPEDSEKKFHIHVFNTHTQSGDEAPIREVQFEEFKKFIKNCTEDDGYPIVLMGDFNVEDGTDEYTKMNAEFAAMKFTDVWRKLKPSEPGHTWTGEDQTTTPDSPYGDLGNVLAVDEGGPQRLDYYYHFIGETKLTSEALEIDTVPKSEEKDELYCFDNDENCNIIDKDGSCDGLKSYTASDHIGLKLKLHLKEIKEEE
jgi:hypothetical protein